ncbi:MULTISPECIES: zinc ribbon domain-containing protein [Thiorhodovibrio]|uniref:zinc ribbon domain-containing protein n=1 Tax=Thiorhodovibrio TaxID=61593 RepID=UPI001912B6F4|nr:MULTISPECIES: zinc ribbon domain-containing protein [Thiorhodovibrio]WPL14109.1 hypothetical protein Thiosp_03942 [Thiorhodovibrio litoralis]
MALIQCPECEGKVSDQAPVCPHCGFPLRSDTGSSSSSSSALADPAHSSEEGSASPQLSPNAYPGKPYHWSDRIPVAFILFWGGMLVGVMGSNGDMVDSLQGNGIQASERTPIGWLAWAMVIGGVIWFVGKNLLAYLHYRNWKIDNLHKEMIEEAEQAEQAATGQNAGQDAGQNSGSAA